jgi:hypothetical protein
MMEFYTMFKYFFGSNTNFNKIYNLYYSKINIKKILTHNYMPIPSKLKFQVIPFSPFQIFKVITDTK